MESIEDEESMTEHVHEQLVDKKNTKSAVWQYFGFEADSEGKPKNTDLPVCRECLKKDGGRFEVSAKNGNTSNLFSHLKIHHIELYNDVKPVGVGASSQPTITAAFEKSRMLKETSKEFKDLTKAVTVCLAKDMLPISTVEKPGFRSMLQSFNPRYRLPSRTYFKRVAIPSLYAETRQRIEHGLLNGEMSFFASTTDLWSSRAVEPYISFTVHYISNNWELTSHCLQTSYIPEDHTGENIKESLIGTLEEWKLDPCKQVAITTDSGSNVKLACTLLKWRRLSCFGHNLNLSVTKALRDQRVERVVKKCSSIVASFSRSWKRRRELAIIQDQKGLAPHKLKADVCTRWGSTGDMIERILEQKEAVNVVLASDRKTSQFLLTWQDLDVLESVMRVLRPLKVMTDLLSGEKVITVSAIHPLLVHICDDILKDSPEDTTLTCEIKEVIKSDIMSRYSDPDTTKFLQKCTFFDPRFKITKSADQATVMEVIQEEALLLPHEESRTDSIEEEGPPRKKSGLSSIIERVQASSCRSDTTEMTTADVRITVEMESYLQIPLLDSNECPLMWWKIEGTRYPLMAQLARKYLCVQATSVASERVFSVGGNIVCDTRTCLKPDTVDKLVFLAKNV